MNRAETPFGPGIGESQRRGLGLIRRSGEGTLGQLEAERGLKGGSPFGALATEMAEKDEGFRVRIARVFRNWTQEISGLLSQAKDQLEADTDPQRLARFIVATLEGATTMARMKRDVGVMHGVAMDLKRFVSAQVRRPVSH